MIAKTQRVKLERLALIKERYHKLILRPRQELDLALQDQFDDEGESSAPAEEFLPQDN